jgi:uncharacterized protein YwqG
VRWQTRNQHAKLPVKNAGMSTNIQSKLLHLIECEGLSRRSSELLRLAKPSITLQLRLANAGQLRVGVSKFGGSPDLPATAEWPTWNGQPLTFIAQIRLADTAPYRPPQTLPEAGFLFFFYDPLQSVWGYEPATEGAWRVNYIEGGEPQLVRRSMPPFHSDDANARPDLEFNEFPIDFSRGLCLPPRDSSEIAALKFSGAEIEAYDELLESVAEMNHGNAVRHQLLGYPDQIQGDMQLECQLASRRFCGDFSGDKRRHRAALKAAAKNWQLLLQIDSDDDLGMMWGDLGRIYYWIHLDDLRARHFESAWFVLQCT